MLRPRISNVPFLDVADNMYATTNKRDFKLAHSTVVSKRDVIPQPLADFQHRDPNYQGKEYRTETALSFPPRPLTAAVTQPKLTHLMMHRTNFELHSDDRSGDFKATQSDLKPLPMCAAKITRPIDAVMMTSLSEGKYPEPTYSTSYIKHKVARIVRAKQSPKTGVGSSLILDKRDRYSSSYHEQFQYRWFPRPPQSTEKERIQCSSVSMGDQEKTVDKITTYSASYRQPAGHSSAEFKDCLLPKINKSQPVYFRELPDHKWTTALFENVHAYKGGATRLKRRCPTLSSVFKEKMQTGNKESPSTTNQCCFPKVKNSHIRP